MFLNCIELTNSVQLHLHWQPQPVRLGPTELGRRMFEGFSSYIVILSGLCLECTSLSSHWRARLPHHFLSRLLPSQRWHIKFRKMGYTYAIIRVVCSTPSQKMIGEEHSYQILEILICNMFQHKLISVNNWSILISRPHSECQQLALERCKQLLQKDITQRNGLITFWQTNDVKLLNCIKPTQHITNIIHINHIRNWSIYVKWQKI